MGPNLCLISLLATLAWSFLRRAIASDHVNAGPFSCKIKPITGPWECSFTILNLDKDLKGSLKDSRSSLILRRRSGGVGKNDFGTRLSKTFSHDRREESDETSGYVEIGEGVKTRQSVSSSEGEVFQSHRISKASAATDIRRKKSKQFFFAQSSSIEDKAEALLQAGTVLSEGKELEKALRKYKHALRLLISEYGKDDIRVANAKVLIGNLYVKDRKYKEAFSAYDASLVIFKKYQEQYPDDELNFDLDVAGTMYNLGLVCIKQNNLNRAVLHWVKSLKLFEEAMGQDDIVVAHIYLDLSEIYVELGRYVASTQAYFKSVSTFRSTVENSRGRISAKDLFGDVERSVRGQKTVHTNITSFNIGDDTEVEFERLTEALWRGRSNSPSYDSTRGEYRDLHIAGLLVSIASLQFARGDFEDAERTNLEALRIYEKRKHLSDHNVAATLLALSSISLRLGHFDNAIQFHFKAMKALSKIDDITESISEGGTTGIQEALLDSEDLRRAILNISYDEFESAQDISPKAE